MAVYLGSTKDIVKGNRNRRSPVTLFIIVCKAINRFLETNPYDIADLDNRNHTAPKPQPPRKMDHRQ